MSDNTFSVDAVVRIVVRGKLVTDETRALGLHRRRDDALLHALNEFLHSEEIIPIVVNTRNGCGIFVGYFETADAERIRAWLLEQGVKST